ncbi:AAA family ATPase [Draconibacterium sediminis]|uniref:AAA family ATPase n=1 Tax=Draconibacterium sediminis TaxID=1544798 RepID=UPI0006990648|nr:AAA family ATPase [Draconibacterium sediminis]
MPFQPQNITRENVLAAANRISSQKIKLKKSTKFDVIIDGEVYPAKDILRYAHEEMNGERIWNITGGEPTNHYLRELGFEIVEKATDKVLKMVSKYKNRLKTAGLNDEIYKWKLIKKYRGRPNIKASDLADEIKQTDFSNLIYHLSKAVLVHLASDRPTETRECFEALFDEEIPLIKRVKQFNKNTLSVYRELNPDQNHHQDERAIAAYLCYHNPDKYPIYKSSIYNYYCQLIGEKTAKTREKYVHYIELLKDFVSLYIENDKELLELVEKQKDKDCYDDPNLLLLAQNILYESSINRTPETRYWAVEHNPLIYNQQTLENLFDKSFWETGFPPSDDPICLNLFQQMEEGDYVVVKSTDDSNFMQIKGLGIINQEINPENGTFDVDWLIKSQIYEGPIPIDGENWQYPILEVSKESDIKKIFMNKLNGTSENIVNKRYWLYSPGKNAFKWEEFYEKGIMALGWEELGDLTQYETRDEIRDKLISAYGGKGSKKNDVSANDDFINRVNIGDVILVKKGRGELLGYGIVDSDYYFDTNRDNFKSCRQVDWKTKGNWKLDHSLVLKTLTDITKYSSEHAEYEKYYERLMAVIEGGYKEMLKQESNQYPLNQILFGPPGTGKTYNSINHALAIIEGKELEELETESEENRQEVLGRYKTLVESGQIVFTTFHQSMSYEDFVEGIKPVEVEGDLQYEVKEGLFKVISENAELNYRRSKESVALLPFSEVWNNFLEPLTEGEYIQVKMKKSSYHITDVNDRTIFFDKDTGNSKHTMNVGTLKNMYLARKNEIIKGGMQSYYEPLLQMLLERGETSTTAAEDKYVMIIDEINRGNIAQIFGELITLLESDKRIGAKEEITVSLPYSKQKNFGVPSNLYIIGTMNTADRSVEALDTALRRRFSFIEMPPNYELSQLENEVAGISLLTILETINGRIEKLLDKDHLIGHSYFLSVDDLEGLKNVFQRNIVPLLQEYFYGDMAKIGLVLGEAFFEKQNNGDNIKFANFSHDAIDDLNARQVLQLRHYWKDGEFEQAIKDLVNPE